MTKWIIGVVILVAAGAGVAWWQGWVDLSMFAPAPAPIEQPQAQTPQEPDNGLSPANDTSDTAIAQDTAAIDAQLTASAQDSSDITSSLSDQPVPQTY